MIAHPPIHGEWKELVLSGFHKGEYPLMKLKESFKYRMLVVKRRKCLAICFCTLFQE